MSVQDAAARIRAKLDARVQDLTTKVRDETARLHLNAPRGGVNYNRHGQPRSAPGEQPAIEDGELLFRIMQPERGDMRGEVVVNYVVLEYGYDKNGRRLAPRPMGRMILDRLKGGTL